MVTGGWFLARRGDRNFGHHRVEGVEQTEVSLRPHRDQRPPQPGLVAAPGALDQTFPYRSTHQLRCQQVQFALVALARAPRHRAPRPRHWQARAVRLETHSPSVDPNESWESRSRLRILRVVTRIWCTASSTSARTARSHTSSSSTCSATARCTGSVGRLRCRWTATSCRARAPAWSRDRRVRHRHRAADCSAGSTARCRRSRCRPPQFRRAPIPTRATVARRGPSRGPPDLPADHAVTWSLLNSASAVPSTPYSTWLSRWVVIRATGSSGRSRTIASTTSSNSLGTVVSSDRTSSGARISVRASGPDGNFRCQPASVTTGAASQRDLVACQVLRRRVEVHRVQRLGR